MTMSCINDGQSDRKSYNQISVIIMLSVIFSLIYIRYPTIIGILHRFLCNITIFDCKLETLLAESCGPLSPLSFKDVCKINYVSNFDNKELGYQVLKSPHTQNKIK